jgi:hypothetical protein
MCMWVLIMIGLWPSGGANSEVIGQFPSEQLCLVAERAMSASVKEFGGGPESHSYKCERLPSK